MRTRYYSIQQGSSCDEDIVYDCIEVMMYSVVTL